MSQEEKDKIKEYQKKKKKIKNELNIKKEALRNKSAFYFFLNMKISEKTLQFHDIILIKKKIYWFKEPLTYFQ